MMLFHNFKTRERGGGETLSDVWGPCEVDLALGGWISERTNKVTSAQVPQSPLDSEYIPDQTGSLWC